MTRAVRSLPPILTAGLIVLMIGLTGPSPAAAQLSDEVGVNIHAPLGLHLEGLLDAVETAHVGWVRIDFVWAWVQPQPNTWSWGRYDVLVEAARARGLEVLGVIAYSPPWATDGAPVSGVPRNAQDWARFCRAAAARYRGRIAAWEVWNEPNLPQFWSGTPEEYVETVLIPGAVALRTGSPESLIGGPGLAHVDAHGRTWHEWLSHTLTEAGHLLDFVSHHVYDSDGHYDVTRWLERDTLFGDDDRFWFVLPPSVRELLEFHGFLDRSFWLTETGFRTQPEGVNRPISESRQADHLDAFLSTWLDGLPRRQWIDKIFVYEIQDDPTPGVHRFGLLRPNGDPKPGYHAVAGVAGRLAVRGDGPRSANPSPSRRDAPARPIHRDPR